MATKKKPKYDEQKVSPAQKGNASGKNFNGAQASKSNSAKGKKQPSKVEKPNNSKSMFFSILPYIMLVGAIIFALCVVIVHFIDEDGAGFLGLWISNILCGLLGGAVFLLPVEMIYVNLRKIFFNVRWKEKDRQHTSEAYGDYARAKKKLTMTSVMARAVVIIFAILLAVFLETSEFDIPSMWEEGMEISGGGVIGGIIGVLMMLAFKQVISIIILITLLVVATIFMLGITPDYIIERIQESRERKLEEREYMNAQLAEEERLAEEEAQKLKAQRMEALRAKAAADRKAEKTAIAEEEAEEKSPALVPPSINLDKEPETYIGPSPEMAEAEARKRANASAADDGVLYRADDNEQENLDFGGEEDFDRAEFTALDDAIKNATRGAAAATAVETPATPIDMGKIEKEELLEDAAEVAPE